MEKSISQFSDDQIIDKVLNVLYFHRNNSHNLLDILNTKIELTVSVEPLEYTNIEEKMTRYLLIELPDKTIKTHYKITDYGKNVFESGGYIKYSADKKELERLQRENIRASIKVSDATVLIRNTSIITVLFIGLQCIFFYQQIQEAKRQNCINYKQLQLDIRQSSKPQEIHISLTKLLMDSLYNIDTIFSKNLSQPQNFLTPSTVKKPLH